VTEAAVEVVRIRPKDGSHERLRTLRDQMVAEYEAQWPGKFSTRLLELEDGTWLDLWTWQSRALAEDVLSRSDEELPAFAEWKTLVEPVSFDWAGDLPWGAHP